MWGGGRACTCVGNAKIVRGRVVTDCQTVAQSSRLSGKPACVCVCVLVLPHLIRIFMHALHCHPGERVTACCLPCLLCLPCCLLRLVICAINTIVQPIKLEGLLPPPLLHSLALMAVIKLTVQQQQQQQKGQQQGQASSGEQRVPVASGNAVLHLHK